MTEKEFDSKHLRMIRAACQHTEGTVHSSVVLQLFDEIDELKQKIVELEQKLLDVKCGSQGK